jgi:hypothetical protein
VRGIKAFFALDQDRAEDPSQVLGVAFVIVDIDLIVAPER